MVALVGSQSLIVSNYRSVLFSEHDRDVPFIAHAIRAAIIRLKAVTTGVLIPLFAAMEMVMPFGSVVHCTVAAATEIGELFCAAKKAKSSASCDSVISEMKSSGRIEFSCDGEAYSAWSRATSWWASDLARMAMPCSNRVFFMPFQIDMVFVERSCVFDSEMLCQLEQMMMYVAICTWM